MRWGRHEAEWSCGLFTGDAAVRSRGGSLPAAAARGAGTLGLLAAAAAVAGGQAAHVRRRYGSAAPDVPSHIEATVSPTGAARTDETPIELAVLGDSSVAGVGVTGVDDTLPVQVAQRVADRSGRTVHVVGHGRSGATTQDVLVHQVAAVRTTPDAVVLVVGTNDVTHLTPLGALGRTTAQLFAELTADGSPLVVSSLPEFRAMRVLPNPLMAAARSYAGLVHLVQTRAAGRNDLVRFVDVRRAVGWEFVDDASTMSADRFHPSAAGYGRIADALAPSVLAMLRTKRSMGART